MAKKADGKEWLQNNNVEFARKHLLSISIPPKYYYSLVEGNCSAEINSDLCTDTHLD